MTKQLTHLHIEIGPAGWLKAHWRRGADEPENTIFCRFRPPSRVDQRWLLVGLEASRDSRPLWLSAELLDDVPRHRVELAVNASEEFRSGLLERNDQEQPKDLDAAFLLTYSDAPPIKLERPARSQLDDDFFRQVALAYRWAVAAGGPPLKKMAEQSGIPQGTIARWVAKARERGFLPPAEPGKVSI